MKNYRDLQVWALAHELTLRIYRVTFHFPKDEQFGIVSQLRRASTSIAANIAEGCGRAGDAELRRFLNIALGSACETDYLLLLATELDDLTPNDGSEIAAQVLQLRRRLGSFIRRLGN